MHVPGTAQVVQDGGASCWHKQLQIFFSVGTKRLVLQLEVQVSSSGIEYSTSVPRTRPAAINSTRLRPSSTPTRVAYSYFVRLRLKWILLPIRDQIGFRLPNRLPKVAVLGKKKYPVRLGNSKQSQYEVFDRQCFSQCLRGFRKIFGGSHSLRHSVWQAEKIT